jgi:hypothetical protein
MANIVISRIQHRRGRRENLPQPLLPAEVALTSDTNQAWIGQDPTLAVASINVYSDKLEATAQSIVDNNVLETRFDQNMSVTVFNTLVAELKVAGGVTLVDDDILWDDTYRGTIETLTVDGSGSSGYTTGDAITAISATGSGFVGTIIAAAGTMTGATIVNGGTNFQSANTTFVVAGGTGGSVTAAVTDINGSVVHIAANPTIDAGNTIANIGTTIDGLSATITDRLMSTSPHAAFGGTFSSNSLIVDNHTEAENVVTLINRVNGTTPGEITGLVYTNLNIEITGGTNAGAVVLPYEAGYYFEGIVLAANALKALHVVTQDVTFASGVASEAYANIVSIAEQIYDLQKNGVSFGSVTFAIGTNIGTVTIGASTTFAKGDRLEVFGPAAPDGTLDQISITLTGSITV